MNKTAQIFFLFILLSSALIFSGCEQSRVFDKNVSLPKTGWEYDQPQAFDVFINDTTVSYNLYINVRHTDAFKYNNIWVKMTTVFPDSSMIEKDLNVPLAEKTGEWTGICVDGICFNSVLMQSNFSFNKIGKYTFVLEQDMRLNPLPNILDIGIKVEKFR